MTHYARWPLQWTLPAAVLLVLLPLLLASSIYNYQNSRVEAQQQFISQVRFNLAQVQRTLEEHLSTPETSAQRILSNLATYPDLEYALLVNTDGKVRASTRYAWLGLDAQQLLPSDLQAKLQELAQQPLPYLQLTNEALEAVYPLHANSDSSSLRPIPTGTLVARFDLRYQQALLWNKITRSTLQITLVALIAAVVLVLLLRRLVLQPLRQLERAARQLAAQTQARPIKLDGPLELRRLAEEFNHMSAAIDNQLLARERSQRQLAVTLDSIGDAVIATDTAGHITLMNRVAEQLTGWSQAEAQQQPLDQVLRTVNAETRRPARNLVQQVLHEGRQVDLANHTLLIARDGREYHIADNAAPIQALDEVLGIVLVLRDISTEYQLRAALSEAEQRWKFALEGSEQGVWDWRVDSAEVFYSHVWLSMLGYGEHELSSSLSEWSSRIHPQDSARVQQIRSDHLEGRLSSYRCEYRLRTKQGQWLWVSDRGQVVERDAQQRPLRMVGTLTDISQRRLAEEELRLAATAFETHEAILITDAQGQILRVNRAFSEMTGYKLEEIAGQTPRVLKSGLHDAHFYKQLWQAILHQGLWEGEIWSRRKNGEVFPQWQTITAVQGQDGQISHFVAVMMDIAERKNAEARIAHLAYYEPLTGLPNRRRLLDQLQQTLGLASNSARSRYGALLFIDLDRFKTINDALGHPLGDELLKAVATRLQAQLPGQALLAHLGGDEFAILLAYVAQRRIDAARRVQRIAERLRYALAHPYALQQHVLHVSASVGISVFSAIHSNAEDILRQADMAMYRAKADGRDGIAFFDNSIQQDQEVRLSLEQQLRLALSQNALRLHYQPQFDQHKRLIGAEVLLRWPQANGYIPPARFIPVAEETGLILDISSWVLEHACRQLAEWNQAGLHLAHLAINISPRQFRQADFPAQVQRILQHYQIAPEQVLLEITERTVVEHIDDTIRKMTQLRQLGVRFSIDDFGTGYSSLSYLKRLPIDQLKIDKSFIDDIATDSNDSAIVEAIIALAHHLELNVIAEGVEMEEQYHLLLEKGCLSFQGFLFGQPVQECELRTLLQAELALQKNVH